MLRRVKQIIKEMTTLQQELMAIHASCPHKELVREETDPPDPETDVRSCKRCGHTIIFKFRDYRQNLGASQN